MLSLIYGTKNTNHGCSIQMLTCIQINRKYTHTSILDLLDSFSHFYISLKHYLLIVSLCVSLPLFTTHPCLYYTFLPLPFVSLHPFICLLLTASRFSVSFYFFLYRCFNECHVSAFPRTHSHSLHSAVLLLQKYKLCVWGVWKCVSHLTVSVALKKLDKRCLLNLGAANAVYRLYCI